MVLNEQFSLVCGARVCRDQSCVWMQLLNVASEAQEIDLRVVKQPIPGVVEPEFISDDLEIFAKASGAMGEVRFRQPDGGILEDLEDAGGEIAEVFEAAVSLE